MDAAGKNVVNSSTGDIDADLLHIIREMEIENSSSAMEAFPNGDLLDDWEDVNGQPAENQFDVFTFLEEFDVNPVSSTPTPNPTAEQSENNINQAGLQSNLNAADNGSSDHQDDMVLPWSQELFSGNLLDEFSFPPVEQHSLINAHTSSMMMPAGYASCNLGPQQSTNRLVAVSNDQSPTMSAGTVHRSSKRPISTYSNAPRSIGHGAMWSSQISSGQEGNITVESTQRRSGSSQSSVGQYKSSSAVQSRSVGSSFSSSSSATHHHQQQQQGSSSGRRPPSNYQGFRLRPVADYGILQIGYGSNAREIIFDSPSSSSSSFSSSSSSFSSSSSSSSSISRPRLQKRARPQGETSANHRQPRSGR